MTLLQRLQGLGQDLLGHDARLQQPLLSPAELLSLRQQAQGSALTLQSLRDSRHPQLGDFRSPQRGSGMDFDESRPYVAGDDRRFINWRLLARTGEMYLKLFHEERRSQLFLLLDRSASMRMGSQGSLKVSQAARLACLLTCLAEKDNMATGAAVINETTHWHRPMSGAQAQQRLFEDFIAAAPPLAGSGKEDLQQILIHIEGQLPAGSVVILLSDFHGLGAQHEAALWALVSKHRVIALQIDDPLEYELPKQKGLRFSASATAPVVELDGRDEGLSQRYHVLMQQHRDSTHQRLSSLGIETHRFSTTDDLSDTDLLRSHLYGK